MSRPNRDDAIFSAIPPPPAPLPDCVMAKRDSLGSLFLHVALEPFGQSSALLSAEKVTEGLDAVSVRALRAALDRAVERTAQRAGVDVRDVQALLQAEDIAIASRRVGDSQTAATKVWEEYAGRLGGFLTGVVEI